jgi:hypothetical protein
MKRLLGPALLGAALVFLGTGCSSSLNKIECKVTMDGTPVEGATVTLIPDTSAGHTDSASGITDKNGVCELKTGDKSGARKGKYKVTVTKIEARKDMDPGTMNPTEMMQKSTGKDPRGGMGITGAKNELPPIYASSETSGLTIDVPPSTNPVELKLSKGS